MIQNDFSRVVCINLDRRPDRWAAFQLEASRYFAAGTVQRFPAIDIVDVEVPSWWPNRRAGWACTNSHLSVIERALHDECETLVVFEDDAVLVDGFEESLRLLMRTVPSDWFGVWIGGRNAHKLRLPSGICRLRRAIATHGYILHRRGLRTVYDAVARRLRDIDRIYCELHAKHPFYAPENFIVGQREGSSDLGSRPFRKDMFWNDSQRVDVVPDGLWGSGPGEALRRLHDALTASGIRFWIIGSLLRAVHKNAPLPENCALGIADGDWSRVAAPVLDRLSKLGFVAVSRLTCNEGDVTEYSLHFGRGKFTLFRTRWGDGVVRWHFYGRGQQRVRECRSHGFSVVQAVGRDWQIPSPTGEYLADVYGVAWESRGSVHYMDNMTNVKSSVVWTGRRELIGAKAPANGYLGRCGDESGRDSAAPSAQAPGAEVGP